MLLFDEYGRPRDPSYIPPEDDYLKQLEQPLYPETEPPQPPAPLVGSADTGQQGTPQQRYLKEASGINTMGPMADQAAQTARDYNASQSEQFDRLGQNMPQQYGQAEMTDGQEGVLTPQETAERMPGNKDAMKELIMKHLLPMHPELKKLSKEGYQNYITAKRDAEASAKEQRRQQGTLNRADAADKDAAAWDQTLNLNAIQGAGPRAYGASDGGYAGGGGPSVQNIGGFTFIRGMMRPLGTDEQAKVNLTNAQADFYRQKPEIARDDRGLKREIAEGRNQTALTTTGMRTDASTQNANARLEESKRWHDIRNNQMKEALALHQHAVDAKDANEARKWGEQIQAGFNQTVAELLARQGRAKQDVGRFFGPTEEQLRDRPFDAKTNAPSKNAIPESYKSLANQAVRYAGMLQDLGEKGVYQPTVSPQARKLIEELSQSYVPEQETL